MSSRLFLSDDINNHNYTEMSLKRCTASLCAAVRSAGGCPSCCLFSSTANAESG